MRSTQAAADLPPRTRTAYIRPEGAVHNASLRPASGQSWTLAILGAGLTLAEGSGERERFASVGRHAQVRARAELVSVHANALSLIIAR